MSEKVIVVGGGSWGTAVANVLADQGVPVMLWARDLLVVESINKSNENPKYLRGIKLHKNLKATRDLNEIAKSGWVVNAIPTQQVRAVFEPIRRMVEGKRVVNLAKGIEIGTNHRVSQIFKEFIGEGSYAILSGPSFAEEVARRLPTAITVASQDSEFAALVQKTMSSSYFRIYRSEDVTGVELAGALKNVIAIAAGIVSGLSLGYNATAAIINRGMMEILRLGKMLGSNPLTFLGLAGMGDLILTCTGPLSRNRKLGLLLAQGKSVDEARAMLGGVAEGVFTCESACALAHGKVESPILSEIQKILKGLTTPEKSLRDLMSRSLKDEFE